METEAIDPTFHEVKAIIWTTLLKKNQDLFPWSKSIHTPCMNTHFLRLKLSTLSHIILVNVNWLSFVKLHIPAKLVDCNSSFWCNKVLLWPYCIIMYQQNLVPCLDASSALGAESFLSNSGYIRSRIRSATHLLDWTARFVLILMLCLTYGTEYNIVGSLFFSFKATMRSCLVKSLPNS